MLSRRSLFPLAAAAALSSCLPDLAPASAPVPHVWLARSIPDFESPLGVVWNETWLHSTDPTFSATYVTLGDENGRSYTPYADRHRVMTALYENRHHGRQPAP